MHTLLVDVLIYSLVEVVALITPVVTKTETSLEKGQNLQETKHILT